MNSGAMKFEPDIEMEASVFNTSASRLWTKLRNNFPTQILAQWETLRLSFFTEENIMNYLNEKISDKIPEVNYNLDAWRKYIDMGTEFLFACHGNRKQQITRWIRERLIYMDTLLGYTVSTNDYITVRANKLGEVYFDIQTFQPMYFSIKFRNEENNTGVITKRVARGETVRFSYNLPVATDQEILVYGGRFIKDLGDLTIFNPTNLLLGNATRLTRVKCNNSPALINASISNCTMLQEVDLRGCSNLGAGSDASLQTLDLTLCRNLRKVDIFGTQLTALHTSQQGGIIQEIIYPYSIQIVQINNQARLTSLGIPCYYTGDIRSENNIFAEKLTEVNVSNCPNVTTFVKNYCVNEDGSEIQVPIFIGVSKGRIFNLANVMTFLTRLDLSHCSNIESITLDNFYNLTEINIDDISLWNATSSNLHALTLTNCPNVETLTFNQNTIDGDNSLGVAFASGTTLDLSGLYNLKTIRSNVGVKGLTKLIVPKSVTALVFDYPSAITYSQTHSDILDIWSVDCNHGEDGFTGIDLLNMNTITDFSMGSLTKINNAINLNIKITNTFPYFNYFKTGDYFKPEGTVDISEYRGSLDSLFKGVDLNKLNIICTEPLPHTSAKHMFAFATAHDVDVLNRLFELMPNVTDFSYMFYNGFLTHAPYIPLRAQNVSYMFYGNATMISTPSNWALPYPIVPLSDYCYTGCVGITTIDGKDGNIDIIPTNWGGYDRENVTVSGEYLEINNTLEREFEKFTAAGQTLTNIVPQIGQTETITTNKLSQDVGEGLADSILISDGALPYGVLNGLTLVNLASEKRSGLLKSNQVVHAVSSNINEDFKVANAASLSILRLEGRTLTNIAPDGETPVLSNDNEVYAIDKGLNSDIFIDDRKMVSTKIYGKTIKNLVTKDSNRTPILTMDMKDSMKPISTIINEIYDEYNENIRLRYDEPFKSAILKGNTRKNEVIKNEEKTVIMTSSATTNSTISYSINGLENDTSYWFSVDVVTNSCVGTDSTATSSIIYTAKGEPFNDYIQLKNANGEGLLPGATGRYFAKVRTGTNITNKKQVLFYLGRQIGAGTIIFKNPFICKSVTGEELPPYFEGLGAVKMPVLKTTGKNLFNINDVEEGGTNWSEGTDATTGMLRVKRDKLIAVKPNTTYVFNKDNWTVISYYDKNEKSLGGYAQRTNTVFTTPTNCYYLRFRNYDNYGSVNEAWEYLKDLQLEEGSTASSFEPHKSNTITCNEDVVLRGIGEVKDELNLLTGELTQRIGEVVLDGSDDEEWNTWITEETMIVWTMPKSFVNLINPISDRYIGGTAYDKTEEMFAVHSDDTRHIQLRLFKTTARNIDELKIYLQSNPITVKYVLESPIIKTVDLTYTQEYGGIIKTPYIFENGNIIISSDILTPTLEYQLPTINHFELDSPLDTSKSYTLRFYGSDNTYGTLGGTENYMSNDDVLTTVAKNNTLYIDTYVSDVMLLEGDYGGKDVPYFNDEPFKNVNATEIITKPTGQPVFGKGGKK